MNVIRRNRLRYIIGKLTPCPVHLYHLFPVFEICQRSNKSILVVSYWQGIGWIVSGSNQYAYSCCTGYITHAWPMSDYTSVFYIWTWITGSRALVMGLFIMRRHSPQETGKSGNSGIRGYAHISQCQAKDQEIAGGSQFSDFKESYNCHSIQEESKKTYREIRVWMHCTSTDHTIIYVCMFST